MSLYIRGIEITKRELLVSIPLILILVAIFTLIYFKIKVSSDDNVSRYSNELSCNDLKEFEFSYRTGVGDVFTNVKIEAMTPQTISELIGEYLYIVKIREDYTMHTLTTCNSKGICTTTTYWSWDYTNEKKWISPYIKLNSLVELSSSRIDNYGEEIKKLNKESINQNYWSMLHNFDNKYIYERHGNTRYYFKVAPLIVEGSSFITLSKEKIDTQIIDFYRDIDQEKLREIKVNNEKNKTEYIIIIAILSIIIVFILFVALENKWLKSI